jgi:polyphosphate glucokinase
VIADLVTELAPNDGSAVGVTVPGVVHHGVVQSAANIDHSWIGTDADRELEALLGRPVHVLNDADAAGYAEVAFGAAKNRKGLVLVTTLGTGIGSALIHDGVLVPNTELGHLEIDGHIAEKRASNAARERHDLSWEKWAKRLTTYYRTLEKLFSPDLFVVGGGVSKNSDAFLPLIDINTEIVPAALGNNAGIIGAALLVESDRE